MDDVMQADDLASRENMAGNEQALGAAFEEREFSTTSRESISRMETWSSRRLVRTRWLAYSNCVSGRHDRCPIILTLAADGRVRILSAVNELDAYQSQSGMAQGVQRVCCMADHRFQLSFMGGKR
jgi:hypothetical protein